MENIFEKIKQVKRLDKKQIQVIDKELYNNSANVKYARHEFENLMYEYNAGKFIKPKVLKKIVKKKFTKIFLTYCEKKLF